MDRLNSFASQGKFSSFPPPTAPTLADSLSPSIPAKAKAESARASYQSSHQSSPASSASAGRPASSTPPPPTAASSYRPRTASNASSAVGNTGGLFVGINSTERTAFFSLLDEYFQSRPHYRDLLQPSSTSTSTPAPARVPSTRSSAVPLPPPSRTPAPPLIKGLGIATALYDFNSNEAEDLSFSEGQRISILEHVSEDWWKGEIEGRVGIFPTSYVEVQ